VADAARGPASAAGTASTAARNITSLGRQAGQTGVDGGQSTEHIDSHGELITVVRIWKRCRWPQRSQ
jgi:hypothetical protein